MGDFFYRLSHGLTGRKLIEQLQDEQPQSATSADDPPSSRDSAGGGPAGLRKNAEVSVVVSIDDTVAGRDRRSGRSLVRKQKALVKAAYKSLDEAIRLKADSVHPRWANQSVAAESAPEAVTSQPATPDGARPAPMRWPGPSRAACARTSAFQETFDPHQPLIAERTLLIIEALFVVIEFAFWYGVFSENVEAHAPTLDSTRISDILLAVMVPLSGIVAARVVGGLTHRVMRRYPGLGRSEYIGASVSAIVAALAIAAIFALVHARFDASSQPLGAVQLPTLAMTLVFVIVLAGDMIARIFLVSEIRAQTDKRFRHLGRLTTRATRADREHTQAWLDLRNAVQMQLDTYERVAAAGARIISDQRSRSGTAVPPLLAASPRAGIRRAHAADDEGTLPRPMAVPSAAQLQLYGVDLAVGPIRVVEDAIDTLRAWPPRNHQDLGSHLDAMLEQLYRLTTETREGAPPDGAQAIASGPRFQLPRSSQAGEAEDHPEDGNGVGPAGEDGEDGDTGRSDPL